MQNNEKLTGLNGGCLVIPLLRENPFRIVEVI